MPTSTHEKYEVEEIYEQLDCLIKAEKGNDNLIVMEDWNCTIGKGQNEKEAEACGLGLEMNKEIDL